MIKIYKKEEHIERNATTIENLKLILDDLGKQSETINFIEIQIPRDPKLLNDKNMFLEDVELIDLIGVPDSSIQNAYEKNHKALKDRLDCIFILKTVEINRGEVLPSDI